MNVFLSIEAKTTIYIYQCSFSSTVGDSIGVIREQVLAQLTIEPAHQISKNWAFEAVPAIDEIFNILQVPHFVLFKKHLH